MEKRMWVCFYYFDGVRNRLLLKYSLEHESPGERKETRNLLAEENRISPDDIFVKLEWK